MSISLEDIKSKIVIKAVRNVRRGLAEDDAGRGMYRKGIRLDLQRSRLLTESYRKTEGEPMVVRRAKALRHILLNMSIYIQEWESIVGNFASSPEGLFFGIDQNWKSVHRLVTGTEGKDLLDDKGREELQSLVDYWQGKSMSDIQQASFSDDLLKYWKLEGTFMWTHWAELGIPDYEKVFRLGIKGIIAQAKDRLMEIDKNASMNYSEQKEFLSAVVIVLEAVVSFAKRYAELALELAERSSDTDECRRLENIARVCSRVPENPPETLHEALQSFFFLHLVRYMEFLTVGIGIRFDKVFGPFLDQDLGQGRITRTEAKKLLCLLWVKFHELGFVYSPSVTSIYGGVVSLQAVTLGGVDEDGNDVTNEMTYLVLETAHEMRTLEPSIALRYHAFTPDALIAKAAEVVSTGLGYPSFFNDKALIPMLEHWGVPEKDASGYAVSGCVYMEIPGKNIARRVFGGMNLPRCLWYALRQGINEKGEQWGAPTKDPRTFRGIEDVMEAYLEQVRFFFGKLNAIENTCRGLYETYLPRPFYSALLDGCIEKGQDSRRWAYPSRVHDFTVLIGPTNVADGITAIRKRVFEEKRFIMEELLNALELNWEGYEEIRTQMMTAPKYGNNDDYADHMACLVHERTAGVIAEFSDRFGYPCRCDGSGLSGTYVAGFITPATPDGRKTGDPHADATLSPIQGGDRCGPTAVLLSAAKINTLKTYNHLLNQKFSPDIFNDGKRDVFLGYLKSWGDLGISHIQFNIVDKKTLLDAQAHPDRYTNLIVRVAGYSAYFVDLSRGLQDSIIARTEQTFNDHC